MNEHRAVWHGKSNKDRIREIRHQFPVIGSWVYDKRKDPDKTTAKREQRWQFVGIR